MKTRRARHGFRRQPVPLQCRRPAPGAGRYGRMGIPANCAGNAILCQHQRARHCRMRRTGPLHRHPRERRRIARVPVESERRQRGGQQPGTSMPGMPAAPGVHTLGPGYPRRTTDTKPRRRDTNTTPEEERGMIGACILVQSSKYQDAPRTAKSMHQSIEDLSLEHLWVIYPGDRMYSLTKRITVLPLRKMEKIASFTSA